MAAAAAGRGKAALASSNYQEAINWYTEAIKESPTSPDFYNQRSTANLRAGHLDEALADAEQSVLNAQKRAKREAIVESQFRRGVALYKLGRFADAEFLLKLVKKLDKDYKMADMWLNKSVMDLNKLPDSDERRNVTVTETPSKPSANGNATTSNGAPAPSTTAPPAQTPADKIKWDWYQNSENIYFSLMVKGAPKDKTNVEITERSLNISFPFTTGSSYDLTLEPLFAPVVPESCTTGVMNTKIEIVLVKKAPGQKWAKFESDEPVATETKDANGNEEGEALKRAVFSDAKSSAPAYPTSSKNGPKDWDKLVDSKDDDYDDEGGDEGNKFFKQLFKNADPDTQRAMMKSYTESNGTALSTNWSEVSKGKEGSKTEPKLKEAKYRVEELSVGDGWVNMKDIGGITEMAITWDEPPCDPKKRKQGEDGQTPPCKKQKRAEDDDGDIETSV